LRYIAKRKIEKSTGGTLLFLTIKMSSNPNLLVNPYVALLLDDYEGKY